MKIDTTSPVYEFDASRSRFDYAHRDLAEALAKPRLIVTMVANDISNRYKGAALGAFWISLTTLATVSGLALLYGRIFGADLTTYYPYVTTGIIVWGLISGLVNDGASAFVGGAVLFTQTPLPKTLLVFRAIGRAIWALAFKAIILVGVLVVAGAHPGVSGVLLSLAGLCLVLWTGFFCALALGTLAARFRDLGQLVDVGLTFAFFATPVFWHADRLGEYQNLVRFNPFYHFLNVVRGPLIGAPDVAASFAWAAVLSALVALFGWMIFGNFARRLPYWC